MVDRKEEKEEEKTTIANMTLQDYSPKHDPLDSVHSSLLEEPTNLQRPADSLRNIGCERQRNEDLLLHSSN